MRDLAGVSKHALLLEAAPVSVHGTTVVFQLPDHLPFHLERLRADTALHELLAQASAQFTGISITPDFVAETSGDVAAAPAPEPARAPDKNDLDDEDDGAIDPTELVVDMLDGEVVE